MSVAHRQRQTQFAADRVFPIVPVQNDSGTYPVYTRSYWLLNAMEQRAYGAAHGRTDYAITTDTYATLQYSLEHPIPDETAAAAVTPIDLDRDGMIFLTQQMLLRREIDFSASFMADSVWTHTGSKTASWSTYTTSTPVSDVAGAMETLLGYGVPGDMDIVMVCGQIVWSAMADHPDLLDRIKYTERASISRLRGALADIFGVREILVSSAAYNSAAEGATESLADIIDDDLLVIYSPQEAGLHTACGGKTFVWGPGGGAGTMYRYYEDQVESTILRIKTQYDQKATNADAGVWFKDVTD
jgi:hypothetical protein